MNSNQLTPDEQRLADALAPFGWTCTKDFWQRYYTDAWVFNLANTVQALSDRLVEVGGPTLENDEAAED